MENGYSNSPGELIQDNSQSNRSKKVDSKQIFLIIGAVFIIIIFALINKYSVKPERKTSTENINAGVIDYERYYQQTGKNTIEDIFSVPADISEYKPSTNQKNELINLDIKPKAKSKNYQDDVDAREKIIQDFRLKQEASVSALEEKLPKKKEW